MKSFMHGKVGEEQLLPYKGWITGAFLPENTPAYDKNLEVRVDYFNGDEKFAKHYHAERKTWTIVLKGCMNMVINDEPISIKEGEFIIYEPGVTEELLSVDPGSIVVSIHTPSTGKSDKVDC